MSFKLLLEESLTVRCGLLFRHIFQTGRSPCLLGSFDDECAQSILEIIGVYPPQSMFIFFEIEGKCRELACGPKPSEAIRSQVYFRSKMLAMFRSDGAIQPIGSNNDICLCKLILVINFRVEGQFNPHLNAPSLQDLKQSLTGQTGKPMTT